MRRAWWPALLAVVVALATATGCGSGSGGWSGGGGGPSLIGGGTSDGLAISPHDPVMHITKAGATLQFKALSHGNPVHATWSIDVADIGTVDGKGLFHASASLCGPTTVTAQVGSASAKTTLTVKCAFTDNPGNLSSSTQGALKGGGKTDPGFKWLYPYDGTVFPRGINPPVLQTGGGGWDGAYLHVSFSNLDYAGFFGGASPEQLALTQALWKLVSMSAQSTDSVQVQLTKIKGGKVTGPVTESWRIAQGTLRGTVYYNSYDSPLAGNSGAILSVRPGQGAKVISAGCRACHTVSSDGSTLVAANEPIGGTGSDRVWDLKNNVATVHDAPNRTWAFGALYPDGTRLLSFGMVPDDNTPGATWAPNVRGLGTAGDLPSRLFDTKTGADLGAKGQPAHMMMPMFSPDGRMIAFNHYDSGTGHSVAVMDFDPSTNTFSNLRDLATAPSRFLGWPAFTPDDKYVFFAGGTNVEYDTVSDDASQMPNPTSDLFAAHVPSATSAMQNALDGLDANGGSYLPFGEANEGHLNFEPTILPEAVGGYFWVVFTSRRNYGNLVNGDAYVAASGAPSPRKKLWVAAIDIDSQEHPALAAKDVTHPAFYLDGQELASGNMRGFWALDPCESNGNDCQTGDECCSGFCREQGGSGGNTFVCVPRTGCAREGEKCEIDADCCGAQAGAQCFAGFCGTPSNQ